MKLGFEEEQRQFSSASQTARVLTERWMADWGYCPNCGNTGLTQFAPNLPVADFFCAACQEQYELKSHKARRSDERFWTAHIRQNASACRPAPIRTSFF